MATSSFLQPLLIAAESVDSFQRVLQSGTNSSNAGDPNANHSSKAYEFVAFLLWYIFLVLCCVIPTCCAYRRRRLLENRLVLQQSNLQRLQQSSNLFILSNLQHNSHLRRSNSDYVQEERLRILTEELKGTTMVR